MSIARLTRFAALGLFLVGCYTLRPTRGVVPEVGSEVAFAITDAGRVAFGGSMGPEIDQVQGRLLEKTAEVYVVAVNSVRLLRGGVQVWSGERVRIRAEHVGSVYERRFSRGRTMTMVAVGVGGFAAFLATRSLLGAGREGDPTPPDSGETLIVRPVRLP